MPNSVLDYVPHAVKAIAHWQKVETKTGKSLLLKDKTTLDEFIDLKDRLIAVQSENLTEANDRQRAQETRDDATKALHPLVKQARTTLKALIENVPGAKALPNQLPTGTDPVKYLQAARDIAEIWGRVNALSTTTHPELELPLTIPLRQGEDTVQITHANYTAAINAYANAVDTVATTRSAEALGRKTRDSLHKIARAKLVSYPIAAKARLADGDPLRATIPTFSNG